MSVNHKLHQWLNSKPPNPNGKHISLVLAGCSFTYLMLGFGTKYMTTAASVPAANSIFIKMFDIVWVGYLLIALACLLISHFFRNASELKNSIVVGVTTFIFVNLLMSAFVFFSLLVMSRAKL